MNNPGYPILRAIEGLGLIGDGLFSQDPPPGYRPGEVATSPTVHGELHLTFAFMAITAVALSSFVLARRFSAEAHWGHGWAAYSVITGFLTIVFIAIFGALGAHGGVAGLFERLSASVTSPLSILVIGRLLIQARAGTSSTGRPHQRA